MRFLFKLFIPLIVLTLVTLSLLILEERKAFDIRTLVQIDPIPEIERLLDEEKYAEASEYLSFFMEYPYVKENPKSRQLFEEIESKRSSSSYQTNKFLEGIITGKSDEEIGRASAIASDFLVIGDIRDLAIQGQHYFDNEEVDNVIVALSSLGLLATASTVYSLGTTTPIKGSISILKYGKRTNKLPSWLNKQLIEEAKIAKETKSLTEIQKLFDPIYKLYEKVGLTQTLHLLQKSTNFNSLKNILSFTEKFGKKSKILLQNTNQKALSYTQKMSKVEPKSILYASTYGEKGLKALSKLGEKKFFSRVGFKTNLLKTTYKGNLNDLFNYLLKNIPNTLLYGIVFLSLGYFMRRFYMVSKALFSP